MRAQAGKTGKGSGGRKFPSMKKAPSASGISKGIQKKIVDKAAKKAMAKKKAGGSR